MDREHSMARVDSDGSEGGKGVAGSAMANEFMANVSFFSDGGTTKKG
jgi:hypothetical protein